MSYAMYEFALNPDVQRRVQEEIDAALGTTNGEINEEVLNKLVYLEQCLMETVRVHSAVFHLSKVNLEAVEFPPQYENSTKGLTIDKGTNVVIPVNSFHL